MCSYQQTLADIKEKYDIDIVAGADRLELDIAYNKAAPTAIENYVEFLLKKELSIYSSDQLKKSKVGRIVLCKNMAQLGDPCHGLADMKLLPLPFRKNTIYLSIRTERNAYDRSTVHHELFHAIDFHDDWSRYTDLDWPKLNAPEFQYRKTEFRVNGPYDGNGFLSTHATTAVREDKAEVYAHLMVNHRGLDARARRDSVLKAKIERMKHLLQKFCPEYDEAFWHRRDVYSVPVY